MPTLSWNLNAEVQSGPKLAAAQTLAVESYDKTEVTIEGNPGKLADLKPGQKVVVTPAEGTATKIAVPKPKKADKKQDAKK